MMTFFITIFKALLSSINIRKYTLARKTVVKNSCIEFYEHPTNGLMPKTLSRTDRHMDVRFLHIKHYLLLRKENLQRKKCYFRASIHGRPFGTDLQWILSVSNEHQKNQMRRITKKMHLKNSVTSCEYCFKSLTSPEGAEMLRHVCWCQISLMYSVSSHGNENFIAHAQCAVPIAL
jgi:hypothetical protein